MTVESHYLNFVPTMMHTVCSYILASVVGLLAFITSNSSDWSKSVGYIATYSTLFHGVTYTYTIGLLDLLIIQVVNKPVFRLCK